MSYLSSIPKIHFRLLDLRCVMQLLCLRILSKSCQTHVNNCLILVITTSYNVQWDLQWLPSVPLSKILTCYSYYTYLVSSSDLRLISDLFGILGPKCGSAMPCNVAGDRPLTWLNRGEGKQCKSETLSTRGKRGIRNNTETISVQRLLPTATQVSRQR